jgi:hypothetical protein
MFNFLFLAFIMLGSHGQMPSMWFESFNIFAPSQGFGKQAGFHRRLGAIADKILDRRQM